MNVPAQLAVRAGAPPGAPAVLLVRPAGFGFNRETAASNAFQQPPGGLAARALTQARAEFDALCAALSKEAVAVCIAEDAPVPPKPDAVFPNNWVSWHADGTVVLYPMLASNRRLERRADILAAVEAQTGFRRRRLLDLSALETEGRYLEGTGSLVLDHRERIAYACRSARTDETAVREWARQLDYEPVVFDACGADGRPLYHTNVMLAIGTEWAVACSRAIAPADRARVLARLRGAGRELVDIDLNALRAFAGNILELAVLDGAPAVPGGRPRRVLALSARARLALGADETGWERLRAVLDAVVAVPIPTIEAVGGGSVRCMLAEIPTVQT